MLDLNAGNAAEAARYYSEQADALLDRYEQVAFEAVHTELLKHLPIQPGSALDVGAGSGRDAAWLARHGWTVVAAEPSKPLREGAGRLHQNAKIQWSDDALPELNAVRLLNRKFDLILLSAVWMHVPPASEETALAAIAELAAPGGIISISVRMGGDEGKRGFYTTDGALVLSESGRKIR
jgi:2-polyprenyl-3-methyl-5-hydroxy-6-metoxy-1,4-benzoquinol methylase